jgi:hypothetical protein
VYVTKNEGPGRIPVPPRFFQRVRSHSFLLSIKNCKSALGSP